MVRGTLARRRAKKMAAALKVNKINIKRKMTGLYFRHLDNVRFRIDKKLSYRLGYTTAITSCEHMLTSFTRLSSKL